ncbi:LLGL2 protein [Ancylostoma ceylanicum]|uniref:LLGL2 protein n=1 Tax=Ancylostoma ceylanicum TaxID=53326 RepID=A0A0D6M7J0_9BILA|nr:LLGL2 protein [Ancylostoma ceylanicum]
MRRDKYPVDLLSVCPTNPRLILMVFDQRLLLSYDSSTNEVLGTSVFDVQCKNITWTREGSQCVVALHDGSYASCDPARATIVERPAQVFGPFPCIPTKKAFFAETSRTSEKIVLFSGGMPHASYGDRFVVTARQGDRTCVFDFASPVIDFLLTKGADGYHTCALVLTENELVCIDLTDRYWRIIPTEQMFPLHASQISADLLRNNRKYSSSAWPLNAKIPTSDEGRIVKEATKRQLYLTGHENGTVRVWSAGHAVMHLLFVIDTRNEFAGFSDEDKDVSEKEQASCDTDTSDDEFQITGDWPPFKKVGDYDPFCDDAGLSIQRVAFDEKSGHIVVGGRAGHVFLYTLEEVEREMTPQTLKIELCEASKLSVPARNSKPLPARTKSLKYTSGYQPCPLSAQNKSMLVQLQPPQPVSAVAVLSARHLIAASNEYGFALIDIQRQSVLLQNTLATATSESPSKEAANKFNVSRVFSDNDDDEVEVTKPVERLIEERGMCPFKSQNQILAVLSRVESESCELLSSWKKLKPSDVFVVGTNGGKLIIYTITDQPRSEDVCKLLKTLALRHAAPIIHVDVIMEPGTRQASSARLIIFTEEQIRSLYLPSLKPTRYKLKLTSTEGLRIRKASIVTLHNSTDLSNCESFAAIVNNHGEVAVYSLLNPKKSGKFSVVKSTDIAGISSMLITPYGELLYLRQGGSELQRATISEHSLPWAVPCQGKNWPEPVTSRSESTA